MCFYNIVANTVPVTYEMQNSKVFCRWQPLKMSQNSMSSSSRESWSVQCMRYHSNFRMSVCVCVLIASLWTLPFIGLLARLGTSLNVYYKQGYMSCWTIPFGRSFKHPRIVCQNLAGLSDLWGNVHLVPVFQMPKK